MGCFPKDSQITIPGGKKAIQNIRIGDYVLRPEGTEEFVETTVREVFESHEELISLATTHGTILTTKDQLFVCWDGKFRPTADLLGQLIGYLLEEKEVVYIRVTAVVPTGKKEKVFHLHVDKPNLYFCQNFLVHNKGGGGSTQSSEASIAPELRPLFSQTGNVLSKLQTFQPQGAFNPFATMQFPGFQMPSGAPAGGPTIDMTQTAPGVFAPTTTPAPLGPTDQATLDQIYSTYGGVAKLPFGGEAGYLRFTLPQYADPQHPEAVAMRNRLAQLEGTGQGGVGGVPGSPGSTGGVGGAPGTSGLPGSVLDEFLFANPQFIPPATPGQLNILGRQQARAFGDPLTVEEAAARSTFSGGGQMRPGEEFATGLSSTFPFLRPEEGAAIGLGTGFGQLRGPEGRGLNMAEQFSGFRFPEIAALLQAQELTGGPIGSSPATQAAMAAVTPRIQNEMTMAGLGRSGALPEALASAYGPIVAQEIAGRQAIIPQLAAMGEAQRRGDIAGAAMFQRAGEAMRAGDITQATQLTNIANAARQGSVQAAQIQTQIAQAQRTGDLAGAERLAALGDQLIKRESTLLGEASTSEEALRELAAMQFQAFTQDAQRRQAIAQGLTTGVLGAFPSVTGSSTVSKTKGGGGMTVICSELYRQGLLDEETYRADQKFGNSVSRETLDGYHWFAIPIARAMRRSKLLTAIIRLPVLAWAKEMRKRVEGNGTIVYGQGSGSYLGSFILLVGLPLCRWLGRLRNKAILGRCWG